MTANSNPLTLTILYQNEPRKCRHFFTALLKQKLATSIERDNYVKRYTLVDGNVVKEEVKRLVIHTTEEKREKLVGMVKKLCPSIEI